MDGIDLQQVKNLGTSKSLAPKIKRSLDTHGKNIWQEALIMGESLASCMMENCIVVTSISSPNETLMALSRLEGWNLIVIGDKKSPKPWALNNCTYLGVEEQKALIFKILENLPWNHYGRKNIGYLFAIKQGARIIWETDDDNIPGELWPNLLPERALISTLKTTPHPVANIYLNFGVKKIWPRGFPLEEITRCEPHRIRKKGYGLASNSARSC